MAMLRFSSFLLLLLLPLATHADGAQLPSQDKLITAEQLAEQRFFQQSVTQFTGWDYAFDGGSAGFFFTTASGLKFTILAGNPRYWTNEEKTAGIQAYFLVSKDKYFRIPKGSPEEEQIVRMIHEGLPRFTGNGKNSPQIVESLLQGIQSRKRLY